MPYYVPRTKYRKAYPPAFRNSLWEKWGPLGKLIGFPLIALGTTLSVLEIIRIIYGPTYRGITNYDDNDNTQFKNENQALLFPIRNSLPFNGQTSINRVEKFHYWPWTYASNLFGLVIIAAGVAGVISAFRRSYSSLFAFLTLSVLSTLLSGYLIGYYAILTNYYITRKLHNGSNRPDTMDTSFGLIGALLATSIATCALGILGFLATCLGLRACTPKGLGDYSSLTNTQSSTFNPQPQPQPQPQTVAPAPSPAPAPVYIQQAAPQLVPILQPQPQQVLVPTVLRPM